MALLCLDQRRGYKKGFSIYTYIDISERASGGDNKAVKETERERYIWGKGGGGGGGGGVKKGGREKDENL